MGDFIKVRELGLILRMIGQTTCLCCRAGVSFNYPRVCPECDHVFRATVGTELTLIGEPTMKPLCGIGSSGHRFAIAIA